MAQEQENEKSPSDPSPGIGLPDLKGKKPPEPAKGAALPLPGLPGSSPGGPGAAPAVGAAGEASAGRSGTNWPAIIAFCVLAAGAGGAAYYGFGGAGDGAPRGVVARVLGERAGPGSGVPSATPPPAMPKSTRAVKFPGAGEAVPPGPGAGPGSIENLRSPGKDPGTPMPVAPFIEVQGVVPPGPGDSRGNPGSPMSAMRVSRSALANLKVDRGVDQKAVSSSYFGRLRTVAAFGKRFFQRHEEQAVAASSQFEQSGVGQTKPPADVSDDERIETAELTGSFGEKTCRCVRGIQACVQGECVNLVNDGSPQGLAEQGDIGLAQSVKGLALDKLRAALRRYRWGSLLSRMPLMEGQAARFRGEGDGLCDEGMEYAQQLVVLGTEIGRKGAKSAGETYRDFGERIREGAQKMRSSNIDPYEKTRAEFDEMTRALSSARPAGQKTGQTGSNGVTSSIFQYSVKKRSGNMDLLSSSSPRTECFLKIEKLKM